MMVKTQFIDIGEYEVKLKRENEIAGKLTKLPVRLAYATYGKLNKERDNVILVTHALTGSHIVAGRFEVSDSDTVVMKRNSQALSTPLWDDLIGSGKAFDTDKYHIICFNYFGSCYGSTGPISINPKTGKQYKSSFPVLSMDDIAETQYLALKKMGFSRIFAAAGGSMGGQIILDIVAKHPDFMYFAVPIAASPYCTNLNSYRNHKQVMDIINDPNFHDGEYSDSEQPRIGLEMAREDAHSYYVSLEEMEGRAKEELIEASPEKHGFLMTHPILGYLKRQGEKFVERFDANTYITLVYAMNSFNLTDDPKFNLYQSEKQKKILIKKAFKPVKTHFFIIGVKGDYCFFNSEQRMLYECLAANAIRVEMMFIDSRLGHDAFLVDALKYSKDLKEKIDENHNEMRKGMM